MSQIYVTFQYLSKHNIKDVVLYKLYVFFTYIV